MSNLTEEEVKIFLILIFQRSFEHFLDVFSPVVSDLLLHQICLKNLLKEVTNGYRGLFTQRYWTFLAAWVNELVKTLAEINFCTCKNNLNPNSLNRWSMNSNMNLIFF